MNQSKTPYMESSFNQPMHDLVKKNRRGGLTVLKSQD